MLFRVTSLHCPCTLCLLSPMQAGAIASFLRELLLSNCARADLVQQDFQECVNMHFQLMPRLTPPVPGLSAAVAGQQGQQQ